MEGVAPLTGDADPRFLHGGLTPWCRENLLLVYRFVVVLEVFVGRRFIPTEMRVRFFTLLDDGYSVSEAAAAVGIRRETGYQWRRDGFDAVINNGQRSTQKRVDLSLSDPVRRDRLSDEALRALEDFDYFRLRYLGRRPTPWQADAAKNVLSWLESDDTEYAVINCPPGSGKSTLFTNDLLLWLICRERSIRILIGSSTQRLAENYSNRLRRMLERSRPLPENPLQGRPLAAEAALSQDFGRFRPQAASGEMWTRSQFTVVQHDLDAVEDKEPTVTAYGMDSEFLGHRANLVIWDDLVTRKVLRSGELIENQQNWWVEEGETRLEPSGLLLLQGQRMGADDLYRYCLDMVLDEDEQESLGRKHKYRHVMYPAHFEDRCDGKHKKDAPAWPEGCLLDPVRLPWVGSKGLATIQRNRGDAYRVQYQQEDVDPAEVLVPKLWIDGGTDHQSGEMLPGCWDAGREIAEIPAGLAPPLLSIATADPSPTRFWSIQWWIVQPATNQRFLMDLIRQSMDAPDFLDWNANAGKFFGVMEEWQERSSDLGYPISHWIVEINAAQRFLLQYDHVRRWQRQHGVQIVGHSTHKNKTDPDFGVQMVKNLYRFGQVRLPGGTLSGRIAALKLVDEVTRYPQTSTDDCLMAQWFLEHQLANGNMIRSLDHEPVVLRRPSWMRKRVFA